MGKAVISLRDLSVSEFQNILVEAFHVALTTMEQKPYAKFPDKLNRSQVAEILEIAYGTVYNKIKNGSIIRYRIEGERPYFKKDEIIAYKNRKSDYPNNGLLEI